MDLEQDDLEPSPLEYARMYGLCTAYDTERPSYDISSLRLHDTDDQDPWSLSDVLAKNKLNGLTKERLTIDKDAALLLRSMHELQLAPVTVERPRVCDIKQELPLLATDEELDMLHFGHLVKPDLRNLRIPTEVVNVEDDEGIDWPAKYHKYPHQCAQQIRAERLGVSRDALLFLQEAVRDPHVPEDRTKIETEELKYKPYACRRSVTPPIFPLSPPLTPYVPSSPANQLCLASDSSGSVTAEAQALEQQIMAADSLTPKRSDSSDSMLLDFIDFDDLTLADSRPTIPQRRSSHLKVEGPLTPPILSDSPFKKLKTVSFIIEHSFIPPPKYTKKVGDEEMTDYGSSNESEDRVMMETIQEEVRTMVESETLTAADTTGRVDVPQLEFVYSVAPWNEYSLQRRSKRRQCSTEIEAQMQFIKRVKLDDLRAAASWPGLSSLERGLRWNIFMSRITKISLDEKLHGETDCGKILNDASSGHIATSSSQVWKLEGLRMLDDIDDDDDDEIESAEVEEQRDIESLLRKRRLEMEEEMEEARKKMTPLLPAGFHDTGSIITNRNRHAPHSKEVLERKRGERESKHLAVQHTPASSANPPGGDLMFGGFSATSALHKFMETRGKTAKQTPDAGEQSNTQNLRPQSRNLALAVRSKDANSQPLQEAQTQPTRVVPAAQSLPDLPPIPQDLLPASFIVSTTYLQRRSLIKQVERHYPAAIIIYRDYALSHSPSKEADVILSPSTGLIETTLQKIKQRPLPGQPDRTPDKLRMKHLQSRYERLIILVSENLSHEMVEHGTSRPTDARDDEALTVLRDLAESLEGEVLVEYVSGGEQALARIIVMQMAKYGLPCGSQDIGDVKLLNTETSWELFLRRAGLNPYAAQVIVALLKTPFNVTLPNSDMLLSQPAKIQVFGLTAFLIMTEEKRVSGFQALMGGSRILRRASRLLDQKWVSAAHGFRV